MGKNIGNYVWDKQAHHLWESVHGIQRALNHHQNSNFVISEQWVWNNGKFFNVPLNEAIGFRSASNWFRIRIEEPVNILSIEKAKTTLITQYLKPV